MKRLNKITLILVAVMGIMISGCGGDIKKAPIIAQDVGEKVIVLELQQPYQPANFKTWEIYYKKRDEWYKNIEKNPPKLISLKGRRDCLKLPVKYENRRLVIEPSKDCPPKDRLNKSYEFTIKTNYGTFKYDTGNKSSRIDYGYRAIK